MKATDPEHNAPSGGRTYNDNMPQIEIQIYGDSFIYVDLQRNRAQGWSLETVHNSVLYVRHEC